ncbi:MAG TPA: alpha/beta hydrolase [Kiloniellales bacterium]|nr:alpha/beta hydrolase [Kiloniellales bacterium]
MQQKRLKLPTVDLTYLDAGSGPPLVLLHGWPEWSAVWRHNIPELAKRFRVLAPDLRNFGDSTGAPVESVEDYVGDLAAFIDALDLRRVGLVGHDVGAFLMQDYARLEPGRLTGLFFFDCPHLGLGKRWVEGGHLRELWYQTFHQLPIAVELVGQSRASCRTYFRHFLTNWSHSRESFDERALEEWVDNFLKPGRLAGGFAWYKAVNARRLAAIAGKLPPQPRIALPAYSLWGASDRILLASWQETLPELFDDIVLELAPEAGHFVHWEQPAIANDRISRFFSGRS